ncbi:MAG: ABC transporter permease, partial [Pseudomonadales bacterium]
MNTTWQLAQRQIRSQWRRADWLTLMLSLFMMTALVTLLTTTSDRLYSSLTAQSADILGADLSLHSQQPINAQKIADAQALGLTSSPVIQFISMAESDEGNVLSTVRAVREPYPLRGTIETRPADNPGFPAAGTVWADQSLLDRLSLSLGDKLYLGYSTFTLSHIIEQSPDRGRGFANFNPQIIMRADELAATEILAPGSRADYRLLISGEAQAIAELESKWKPALAKGQRLLNARDDSQLDGSSVANASRYLKLSALLSLLLGAVAILLSLQRYSADQRTRSALLLSLGMTPRQLVTIYCWQLFIGWLVAAVIGTIAGYALHQVIAAQLSEYLPHVANLSISSIVTSPLLALAILFILGLPTLLPLGRISIMQMLRAEKRAASNRWHYIACAALLLLAIGLYMGSFVQALVITALLLGLGWIAGFIAQHSINFAIHRLFSKLALAPLLKLRLRQQRHWHRLQAGVFSLLLAILAVLFFVRNDLIGQWQSQLPENTPNQFAVNIQPSERDRLESWMTDNELEAQLFPIVRGRITHLNKQPVADVLSQEQLRDHALRRELNLTWQTELAEQNAVLEGTWNPQVPGVSIERELSEELGFKLGDTIGITIGSQQLHAPVTSIRN